MVFGCLTFDMLGEAGAKPCFGSSRQLFPDFFWGGRAVKDGWFPQEIAMKSHHIYIYISIIISIYINISFKILEASTRWWRRFQGCWWGAGDVLRLPRWYRDVSHCYSIPKDQWVHSSAKDMASMLSLYEIMRETHMIVYVVCSQTYDLFVTSRYKVDLFDGDSTPCFTVTHNPWFTC